MIAPDVNVLVSALVVGVPDHDDMRHWLERAVDGAEPVAVTHAVATGVVRVVTHPKVFASPVPPEAAVRALGAVLVHPNVTVLGPGPRYWEILARLCAQVPARGNLVADAGHAATAIERGLTWVSKDSDFAKFAGLRWVRPT